MSPRRFDPDINYKRLRQLYEEFDSLWKRLQALYLDAVAGFTLLREHVETKQTRSRIMVQGTELDTEQFQNTRMFSYDQIFSDSFCTSSIHRATQGEAKMRNSSAGANIMARGQLCLISFYDFWKNYLSKEYFKAKGKFDPTEKNKKAAGKACREHASHDLWSDIGYLRNSIVHNKGIALSNVKNCKLIKWFKPDDEIALTPDHMRDLFLAFLKYRDELFKEQFAEHYIKVPKK